MNFPKKRCAGDPWIDAGQQPARMQGRPLEMFGAQHELLKAVTTMEMVENY